MYVLLILIGIRNPCPTGQVLDDPQEVLAPEVLELWAGNVTLCFKKTDKVKEKGDGVNGNEVMYIICIM